MEKKTSLLLYFFIIVLVITLLGFFNTYLKFLPDFSKFPFLIHLHFFAFLAWFFMLIVQPILIKRGHLRLHRTIGKSSYFLAPILLFTILSLSYTQIHREVTTQNSNAPITAFVALIDSVSFTTYYLIAMINSKNIRWHVAFLIATTLVILNPGLSRFLNHFQHGLGLIAAILLPFFVSIVVILFEKIKYKKPVLKSPYFLYFCSWTMTIFLFITIPTTEFWTAFVSNTFR